MSFAVPLSRTGGCHDIFGRWYPCYYRAPFWGGYRYRHPWRYYHHGGGGSLDTMSNVQVQAEKPKSKSAGAHRRIKLRRLPFRSRSRSRSKDGRRKGHPIPYRPRGLAARRGPAAKGSTRGHSARFERCVKHVKKSGRAINAYAVCTASTGW